MKWIDKIPLLPLAVIAGFLAMAPFKPQPHLWEKLNMLVNGSLSRPIDIVDLALHGLPLLLLLILLIRRAIRRSA